MRKVSSTLSAGKGGLGDICFLWMQSPLHVDWKIGLMKASVLPAMVNESYLVFYEDERPVAYVSWAYLGPDDEVQYIEHPHSLSARQWRSGDRLWFIDVVAPFGHILPMMRYLRNEAFPEEVGRFRRYKKGSRVARIASLHGSRSVGRVAEKLQPIHTERFRRFRKK